jgi:hypothetical protein
VLQDGDEGALLFKTKEAAQAFIDAEVQYYIRYYKTEAAGRAAYKILRLEEP